MIYMKIRGACFNHFKFDGSFFCRVSQYIEVAFVFGRLRARSYAANDFRGCCCDAKCIARAGGRGLYNPSGGIAFSAFCEGKG